MSITNALDQNGMPIEAEVKYAFSILKLVHFLYFD